MRQGTKASLLFCALLLCALGAVFSPKEPAKDREPKTQVMPVNNQRPHRGIWLRV
jgi:hypothetical protein